MQLCSIEGCGQDTSHGGQGHCGMHRARLARTGTVGAAGYTRKPGRTNAERVYPRLVERDGCWIWTGATRNGCGAFGVDDRVEYVHRWVYMDLVGEIPEGLVLDHLCIRRTCANPEHLDPVTRAVNNARGGFTQGTRAA